ncbi:hypothetical protein TNCV_2992891 [Trichonephila clavipes]|nr:hypothetical protein TNCV_2992891 [Trichonephila clavipes]
MPSAYYYPSDCEGDIRSPFRKCTSPLPVYEDEESKEESEEELLVPESPKVSKPKKRLSRIRNNILRITFIPSRRGVTTNIPFSHMMSGVSYPKGVKERGATFSIFVRGDKTARASPTLLHYYTVTKNNKPH